MSLRQVLSAWTTHVSEGKISDGVRAWGLGAGGGGGERGGRGGGERRDRVSTLLGKSI